MKKVQKIFCDVFDCKYCDTLNESCKLKSIKISTRTSNIPEYSTLCENFKEIK